MWTPLSVFFSQASHVSETKWTAILAQGFRKSSPATHHSKFHPLIQAPIFDVIGFARIPGFCFIRPCHKIPSISFLSIHSETKWTVILGQGFRKSFPTTRHNKFHPLIQVPIFDVVGFACNYWILFYTTMPQNPVHFSSVDSLQNEMDRDIGSRFSQKLSDDPS
jgi:hypothetical protein